ncbi:hypothetical protein KKA24_01785 [Patescibacteria group bacterium]|nr:hypothetical protein [Patescibacteria group bacterium]
MIRNNSFTKPYNTAIFAYSVLKRLNSGNVNNFSQRFLSQKYQYFAQVFGVSPHYIFNLYLNGPYSPSLTQDLFKMHEDGVKVNAGKFIADDLEKQFVQLEKFLDGKKLRELELVATLHWLFKVVGLPMEKAEKRLADLKDATSSEFKYAMNSIKKLPK